MSFSQTMAMIKPLGLVLMVTAHMLFNGQTQAEVIGVFGTNITLNFTFENITQYNFSIFSLYIKNHTKIDQCFSTARCPDAFFINSGNRSISYHIQNLNHSHSQVYYASLLNRENMQFKESNRVRLVVRKENRNSTVSPNLTLSQPKEGGGSSRGIISSHMVVILLMIPPVLLLIWLSWLIFSIVRTKGTQQQHQQTTTTTQESNVSSQQAPASSLVYSVLDFPKRPQTVTAVHPSDTEYADVSCLPEKTQMETR